MKLRLTAVLVSLFFVVLFSEDSIPTRGTITKDIVFTTYAGETYSLMELLKSGKHVYCTSYKYPG